jgi:hypothetical protein
VIDIESRKPLGRKAYGSIPHLIGSRLGPGDHHVHAGQHAICTERLRDKNDEVIVQLKLDGSNVAVAKQDGQILALTRAGYLADTSPYPQHHLFAQMVAEPDQAALFAGLLNDGEWLSGEWLAQAHGTRYDLTNRSPFVVFDLFITGKRTPYDVLRRRVGAHLELAPVLYRGGPLSVFNALNLIDARLYGELDTPEGAVWRVERTNHRHGWATVDFLAKYVRPEKIDGRYLPEMNNGETVWNWQP